MRYTVYAFDFVSNEEKVELFSTSSLPILCSILKLTNSVFIRTRIENEKTCILHSNSNPLFLNRFPTVTVVSTPE